MNIAATRLQAQRLTGERPLSAVDVVRQFGAVQAQDYPAAIWALGQRTSGTNAAEIDRLYDEGAILRTHLMRPTWHFVVPDDVRWLVDLTGPRLRRGSAGRHGRLELDDATIDRSIEIIAEALAGGTARTRRELGGMLQAAGIAPDGQRLPHILGAAEYDGVIVSGPRRGKDMTYMLLADRAPAAPRLDREEALAELTRRYFRSHGPAQIKDFAWWSGLTLKEIRAGLAMVGADLEHRVIDGTDYWMAPDRGRDDTDPKAAHLLPVWDEYVVAYRDRDAALLPHLPLDPALFPFGPLSNVLLIEGKIRGTWRRTIVRDGVRVELQPLEPLAPEEAAWVEAEANRLGRFLELPAEVTWSQG